jgi:hypothetical protein
MKGLTTMLLALALPMAGCGGAEDPAGRMTPADQLEARALQESYQAARARQAWEDAEAHADELRRRFPDSDAEQAVAASLAEVRKHAESVRELRRLREAWSYQAVAVEGGTQRTATLYSRTPPAEEGMPLITPDAQLVLRDHPAWGRSAYLLLAQKRFACPAPCTLRIGFDAAPPRTFAGRQADSGKGPALFIEDDEGFIAALSTAREIKLLLPEGSGAVRSLSFEVAGYQPARYARP